MITYSETLDLIKDSSSAKYCTPETPLSELDIDIVYVLSSLLEDCEVHIHPTCSVLQDGKTIQVVKQLTLSRPIKDITTLGELLDELRIILFNTDEEWIENSADTILHDFTEGWYMESSYFDNTGINAKRFRQLVSDLYDVEIEKGAITKQYGTVKAVCEGLTTRINNAIKYQKHI